MTWLWFVVPPVYIAGWYGAVRALVHWDAIVAGKQPKRNLIWTDLGMSFFWPLFAPVLLLWFALSGLACIVVAHLERVSLPESKRSLPDLRDSDEAQSPSIK
jgi:hypothetical protein